MEKENRKVIFGADRVKVYGPKVQDNSYTVTFETGEYEQAQVAQLMMLPQQKNYRVTVEVIDDTGDDPLGTQ